MKREKNNDYELLRERLCFKANILYVGRTIQNKDKLFNLHEYLPNLLRMHINEDYYITMLEYGTIENVLEEMIKTKNYSIEENIKEFIDWIDKHDEFNNLLNVKEYDKLVKQLKVMDELFPEIKKRGKI